VSGGAPIDDRNDNKNERLHMRRLLQLLFLLILLGILAVIGYAYFGDMTPEGHESRIEVTLPGVAAPAAGGTEGTGGN